MKRIIAVIGLIIVLLLPAVAFSCSSSEEESNVNAELGKQFTLTVGKTADIASESLSIKFVEVISDNRCPRGVECVAAGEVKCRMLMTVMRSPAEMILTQTGGNPSSDYFLQYKISFRVTPYPQKDQPLDASSYVLTITVTK